MGIFFTDPPKRITKRELGGTTFESGVLGGLRSGEHRLTDHEFNHLKTIIGGYTDAERKAGKDWGGISAPEVDQMMQQMKENKVFSDKKLENIEKHLRKGL